MLRNILKGFALAAAVTLATACSKAEDANTVWVYTSMFPETIELFDKAIKEKFPDITVKWFQNGSENVNAKIALEQLSGEVKADIVLTADVFWFRKMAEEGFWHPRKTALGYDMPEGFAGKNGEYTTPRISVMAIGYNKKFVSEADAPKSFKELADPKWRGKTTAGSPLESGTNYSLMVNFAYKYGYDFLKQLRANDLMSAGGNSAVLKRIVTGERPVGMILVENLLAELRTNPNVGIVYPEDGAVLVSGPMGLVKKASDRTAAEKIYDFILSKEGQQISVAGLVHVPNPEVGAPAGAKTLAELRQNAFEVSEKFYDFVKAEEKNFKERYAEIMFE